MEDTYFDSPTPEEAEKQRLEEEQQRKLARSIRDEVRRIQTGEADADIAADNEERTAAEQEDAERERLRAEREEHRKSSWFWLLATGDVLIKDGIARYYRSLAYIAFMFFLSIVTLFSTLGLEMRCNRLENEVELLHERSIRLQEQCYQRCSHSAIIQNLRERGIDLYDPLAPTEVLE